MLRSTIAVAATLCAAALSARAADPDLSGNWLISYGRGSVEQHFAIVKIETKDGKGTATVVATPFKGPALSVKEFKQSGKDISITLSNGPSFVGTVGDDPKQIRGGFGNDSIQFRARMVRTESDTIAQPSSAVKLPEPMTKATQLTSRVTILRNQARIEKDADKKKDLTAQADKAQQEADEQAPALYREVIEKHATEPAAIDACAALLTSADKYQVKPDEASKLLKLLQKQTAAYGPKYARFTMIDVLDTLGRQPNMAPIARDGLKELADALTDKDPVAAQVRVLESYKSVLERTGKTDELKAVDARLAKMESKLDEEYMASVPPFKPAKFAGRKESSANKVAVLELFTGAQCPPCVAADVAFDALGKAYNPSDLVLIQYHMHIPGPDPMTNKAAIARWEYYGNLRGTPSTLFNGKVAAGGGGGMANAENKFKQYVAEIDPILEASTPIKIGGKATRSGDAIKIAVEVTGAAGDDMKLRLLVVEDTVKFVGGNGLRFHHHVVRAMPGGADGVAIKDATFKHSVAADVSAIRKELTQYLDDYAANTRPFPQPGRPLDMKQLKVIALVQNDKTKEIAQALLIEVEGGAGR